MSDCVSALESDWTSDLMWAVQVFVDKLQGSTTFPPQNRSVFRICKGGSSPVPFSGLIESCAQTVPGTCHCTTNTLHLNKLVCPREYLS